MKATDATYEAALPLVATRTYVYASYLDEVVCVVDAGGRKYVHSNHLYSPAALTDPSGAVIERYRYDAYGRRTVTNAAGVSRLASSYAFQRGFTGYHLDAESGLYYARARMYSPGLGRFVSRDILEMMHPKFGQITMGANYSDGYSLYAGYFAPNHADPSGHSKCCVENFHVPTNVVPPRITMRFMDGKIRVDAAFEMEADFINGPLAWLGCGCKCTCCEYRQKVTISFDDGHGNFNPGLPGGPNLQWPEDSDAAGHHYGHRGADFGNMGGGGGYSKYTNNGCSFRGRDTPGVTVVARDLFIPGVFFTMDFLGEIVDVCNGGTQVIYSTWNVDLVPRQ